MPVERRIITTPVAVRQRIVQGDAAVTTNATPLALYTSAAVIPEARRLYIRAEVLISTPTASSVSSIIAEGTLARATGGALRLVASNFTRSQGEIANNRASVSIGISSGRFQLLAQGSTGNTYHWTFTLDLLRNV